MTDPAPPPAAEKIVVIKRYKSKADSSRDNNGVN
jgi:hypothetical protein